MGISSPCRCLRNRQFIPLLVIQSFYGQEIQGQILIWSWIRTPGISCRLRVFMKEQSCRLPGNILFLVKRQHWSFPDWTGCLDFTSEQEVVCAFFCITAGYSSAFLTTLPQMRKVLCIPKFWEANALGWPACSNTSSQPVLHPGQTKALTCCRALPGWEETYCLKLVKM